METIFVEIVSPSGSTFKGKARSVIAPGTEGSFEILRNHAPMIASFETGSLVIGLADDKSLRFATSGGFLEVLNNTVTILAETAELATEIDIERAKAAEEAALQWLESTTDESERAAAAEKLEHARNRARVAMGSVGSQR